VPSNPAETVEFLDVDDNIIASVLSPCCDYVSFLGIISETPVAKIRINELLNFRD
jgi:hypothetical protein